MADTIKSIQFANGNTYTLDADLLDSHESSYFVDTATNQTISGSKIFSGYVQLANNFSSNCWYQNKKSDDQTASLSYISQEGGNISIDTDYENKGYLDLSATRIDSDITPSADATYTLGGSTLRWKSVYGTTVSTDTLAGSSGPYIRSETLCPTASSSDTLGMSNSDSRWSASYVKNTYTAALNPIDSTSTKITSSASIVPDSGGSFDLGSVDSNCAWNDLYIKRLCSSNASYSISSYSSIVPSTTSTFSLGSSDYIWTSVYTNNVYTNYLYSKGGSTIYCISNLYPSSTGMMSLGASTYKWASSYVTSSYTNYLYPITSGGSIKSYASILPGNPNSYSLGSLSYNWYEVYAGNMFAMYNTNNYIKLYADSSYSYLNNVREGSSYKLTLPTKAGAIPVVTDATGVSFSAIDDKEYNLIDVPDKYDSSISIGYRSSSSSQPTSLDFTSTTTLYYSRVSFPCITPGCGLIIIRVLCFSRSDDTWYRIPYKTLTGLNTKNYTINLISINVMDYKTTLANQAAQWVVHYGTEGNDPNYVYVGCDYPNASSGWYGTLILFYTS